MAEEYISTSKIVEALRSFLPEKVPYGSLVAGVEFANAGPMVYPDPEFCVVEDAANRLEELEKQLESLRKERDAAVQDLKILADNIREYPGVDTLCCGLCAFNGMNEPSFEYPGSGDNCPGVDTDNCFQWRGMELVSAKDVSDAK